MKVSAAPVTRRKAQKSTASTNARMGIKSDGGFQMLSEIGSKNENLKEGVEVAKRYCHASSQSKPLEQGSLQFEKVGV